MILLAADERFFWQARENATLGGLFKPNCLWGVHLAYFACALHLTPILELTYIFWETNIKIS
jgi:hypothetical protein